MSDLENLLALRKMYALFIFTDKIKFTIKAMV